MKIVFMGTPDFAVASLANILKNEHDVVAVVTAPDRKQGRGRKVQPSAVKQFALEHELDILQPTNLKDEGFIQTLEQLEADMFIVVAFRMLPASVWKLPKYGTVNLHASLLPNYRGAAPINWAIINGETETGVTTFFINENIDTGDIILQKSVNIQNTDSAGDLHDCLMDVGANLLIETIALVQKGDYRPLKQDAINNSAQKPAPKLFKEDGKIDWSLPGIKVQNKIRGLSPYPGAWSTLIERSTKEELMFKVLKSSIVENINSRAIGNMEANGGEVSIVTGDGKCIKLEKVQIAGKRAMNIEDLTRGFDFNKYDLK